MKNRILAGCLSAVFLLSGAVPARAVDSGAVAEVIGGGSGGADINLGKSGDGNGYHCSDEGDDLFHDVVFLFC